MVQVPIYGGLPLETYCSQIHSSLGTTDEYTPSTSRLSSLQLHWRQRDMSYRGLVRSTSYRLVLFQDVNRYINVSGGHTARFSSLHLRQAPFRRMPLTSAFLSDVNADLRCRLTSSPSTVKHWKMPPTAELACCVGLRRLTILPSSGSHFLLGVAIRRVIVQVQPSLNLSTTFSSQQ